MPAALVHNVYFTLCFGTAPNIERLVDSCYELLRGHPGELYFAAGPLVAGLDRPVNVRDFHVGLHVVFASLQDHDAYQVSARHERFITANKASWLNVRVFDTFAGR